MTPLLTFDAADVPEPPGAHVFTVRLDGREREAFAVRLRGGAVRAYVNDCPHFRLPLDRGTGDFFARGGRRLLCHTHGAEFRPEDGLCETGPCAGDALIPLQVAELFGQVQVFAPPPGATL